MRRVISRSLWRKLAVTSVAVVGFVLLYEVSMFDSRNASPGGPFDPTAPAAGARLQFTATAYCKGTTTASGVGVRTGIAASDPSILPVGSVVNISTDNTKYNGVYTIMDTGPKVQGRLLDLYMWSCHEALAFGRKAVEITVLRLGWSPSASTPSLIDRLFRRREASRNTVPAVKPAPAPDGTGTDSGAINVTSASAGIDGATVPSGVAPEPLAPSAPAVSLPPVAPASNVPR
jgi:3D (Asp-Asp-Asp) domain-containing protein